VHGIHTKSTRSRVTVPNDTVRRKPERSGTGCRTTSCEALALCEELQTGYPRAISAEEQRSPHAVGLGDSTARAVSGSRAFRSTDRACLRCEGRARWWAALSAAAAPGCRTSRSRGAATHLRRLQRNRRRESGGESRHDVYREQRMPVRRPPHRDAFDEQPRRERQLGPRAQANYSDLSACITSTRDARAAGISDAIRAAAMSTAAAPTTGRTPGS
jgi:hypothetical protein